MHDVAALMSLWPSVSELARDIGILPTHAHVMKVRGSIPPAHWAAVIRAAESRGIEGVTLEVLDRLWRNKPATGPDAAPQPERVPA